MVRNLWILIFMSLMACSSAQVNKDRVKLGKETYPAMGAYGYCDRHRQDPGCP